MRPRLLVLLLLSMLSVACATQGPPAPRSAGPGWLDALSRAIGDRPVVQLGESGHGMAETYTIKTEIVRHLHQRHGFDVLAVEGGIAECWVAAQHLRAWPAEDAMRACLWGAWASEEAKALFEYLREAAASGRPLRLVGFDNSPTSRAFSGWLAEQHDLPAPLLLAERGFLRLFDGDPDDSTSVAEIQARAVADYHRALAGIDDPMLVMIIEDRLATLDFDPADFDRDLYEEIREQRMAVNLLRHLQRAPGSRVLVWAHNAHVAHAYSSFVGGVRRQGEYVHAALGDDSYTLGIYPLEGRGYAWFINQEYDLRPPPDDSLETRLAKLPGNPVFLDLHGMDARAQSWVRRPVISFEWGLNEQLIVPAEMYDGLLLIRKVNPISRRDE